jgi:hypothetical protein
MPFTPTPDLPSDPTVRVFFSGLMILDPSDDAKSCEVFVNHSAPKHHLTIEIRRKRPNRPDELMMRHVGPLAFTTTQQPVHGFIIEKRTTVGGANVPNAPEGVRRYDPAEPPEDGEPDGLGLAVNLSGAELHQEDRVVGQEVVDANSSPPVVRNLKLLDIDPIGGRPSISINDGVFHTAAKIRPDIDVTLQRKDGPDRPLAPFASLIGANIYLDDKNQAVDVRWRNQGRLETLTLRRPKPEDGENFSYEIYIVNDPLFENDSLDEPKHDEFREYYKILPNVDTADQFKLKVTPAPASAPRGTTKAPCMSVLKRI